MISQKKAKEKQYKKQLFKETEESDTRNHGTHMYPIWILQAFAPETPETEDGRSQFLTVH